MLKSLLFVTFLASLVTSTPKELTKFSISSYILPNKVLEMQLDVVVPRSPNTYPVILFITGLSGLTPDYFQADFINSIAEQGYAFMTVLIILFSCLSCKVPIPRR